MRTALVSPDADRHAMWLPMVYVDHALSYAVTAMRTALVSPDADRHAMWLPMVYVDHAPSYAVTARGYCRGIARRRQTRHVVTYGVCRPCPILCCHSHAYCLCIARRRQTRHVVTYGVCRPCPILCCHSQGVLPWYRQTPTDTPCSYL